MPARIGPYRLEIHLPPEFRNRPPATQNGDALPPQPSTMKGVLLLRIHHGPRSVSISADFPPVGGREKLRIAGFVNDKREGLDFLPGN